MIALCGLLATAGACRQPVENAAPPPAPVAVSPPPASAPDAAAQAAMEQAAAEARANERLAYDREHLPQIKDLLAFVETTRARYDKLYAQVSASAHKESAVKKLEKLRAQLLPAIEKQQKASTTLASGRSNVQLDLHIAAYDMGDQYPRYMTFALRGDDSMFTQRRAELDARLTRVRDWIKKAEAAE